MSAHRAAGFARHGSSVVVSIWLALVATLAASEPLSNIADALLAIDQQRASVVARIIERWGVPLAQSSAAVSIDDLRTRLMSLRADRLLAATLAGTEDGLREVTGYATAPPSRAPVEHLKALGDTATDVVYTPVTPCRLVETRGAFAAVYQGDGTPSHTPTPFASNQIRTYTVQGGNGVCLAQLPADLTPSAIQLQVFGMPTSPASGDIEILPQGATFGSTATMVYVGSIAFNTVSTAAKINTANKQISVQVRGGGAHLAIDVVGYFAAPTGTGGKVFLQGGNAFGTVARLGTLDDQPLEIHVDNQRVMRYQLPPAGVLRDPNVVGGHASNSAGDFSGQTIAGGGSANTGCLDPSTNLAISCANRTVGDFATIGGGTGNQATNSFSTVAGGFESIASGNASLVAGGSDNVASGNWGVVAGGGFNTASGQASFVAGGLRNVAAGATSFAAGSRAKAMANGTFVFGDSTEADVTGAVANQFIVAASSNIIMAKNKSLTAGCFMPGATWACTSDRNMKRDFAEIDAESILQRVAVLPLSSWRYDNEPTGIRHIGPTSQDFRAAFGLGHDDKTITMVDADGIALAAIQGLHQLVQERDAQIATLIARVAQLEALHNEVAMLKSLLSGQRVTSTSPPLPIDQP